MGHWIRKQPDTMIFDAFRLTLKFYRLWIAMNTINLTTIIMLILY
jgi:hypothetical protein